MIFKNFSHQGDQKQNYYARNKEYCDNRTR